MSSAPRSPLSFRLDKHTVKTRLPNIPGEELSHMNSLEQKLKLGRSNCKRHSLRAYLCKRGVLQFNVIIPCSLFVRRPSVCEQSTGAQHGCPAAPLLVVSLAYHWVSEDIAKEAKP